MRMRIFTVRGGGPTLPFGKEKKTETEQKGTKICALMNFQNALFPLNFRAHLMRRDASSRMSLTCNTLSIQSLAPTPRNNPLDKLWANLVKLIPFATDINQRGRRPKYPSNDRLEIEVPTVLSAECWVSSFLPATINVRCIACRFGWGRLAYRWETFRNAHPKTS